MPTCTCMYHIFFHCSSISRHLVSNFVYCELCCNECVIVVFLLLFVFCLFICFVFRILTPFPSESWRRGWYIPTSGITRSYSNSIFKFLRRLYTIFHNSCMNLCVSQNVSGPFSKSSSAFILCLLGHSSRCEMIPHCWFDLHFSNEKLFIPLAICLSSLKKWLSSILLGF